MVYAGKSGLSLRQAATWTWATRIVSASIARSIASASLPDVARCPHDAAKPPRTQLGGLVSAHVRPERKAIILTGKRQPNVRLLGESGGFLCTAAKETECHKPT
jgi:hypothetical protein